MQMTITGRFRESPIEIDCNRLRNWKRVLAPELAIDQR